MKLLEKFVKSCSSIDKDGHWNDMVEYLIVSLLAVLGPVRDDLVSFVQGQLKNFQA